MGEEPVFVKHWQTNAFRTSTSFQDWEPYRCREVLKKTQVILTYL